MISPYDEMNLRRLNRFSLDDSGKRCYDILFDSIVCEKERSYLGDPSEMPLSKLDVVMDAVATDCPDTYCLDFRNPYSIYVDEDGLVVEFNFCYDPKKRQELRTKLYREVSRVAELCLRTCGTDFEKELFVHDHLAKTVEYTHETDVDDESEYTAMGAIINRKAVCMGISKAASILLNAVGVGCGCISNERHMWNIVRVDGKLYHLDITSDMLDDSTIYDYFNINNVLTLDSHPSNIDAPCTSLDHNWYRVMGLEIRDINDLFFLIRDAFAERKPGLDFRIPCYSRDDVSLFVFDFCRHLGCKISVKTNPHIQTYHLRFIYI